MPKKFTPEEYKKIFDEQYPNYELLSEYLGDKKYITVRCKLDGNIWKTKPNWLKHGAGCQKCYDRRRGNTLKKTTEQFINDAKKVHGDKYDYSKVEYKGNKTKVCIICPEHGEFWMRPDKHLSGQGCDKCADTINGFKKRLTIEEFIKRSREVHGDKYDYSKVNYITCETPVCIICPVHGEFWQIPYIHMTGSGCPKCNESKLEREMTKVLTENNINFESQKKFHDWLGAQSLDFYLPDYNIGIECQGSQHYEECCYNGWDLSMDSEVIERDFRKNKLCQENNIKLFYYSKSKKVFDVLPIYNEENTFFRTNKLLNKIME